MTKIARCPTISYLVTNWGEWPCPPDLVALWEAAPKRPVLRDDWDGGHYTTQIVDGDTPEGAAYYARERALISAIDTIMATPGLEVVSTVKKAA